MRSFVISLAATILAFVCGIVTASSWDRNDHKVLTRTIIERCPETTESSAPAPAVPAVPAVSSAPPVVFFGPNLKLVAEDVKLKSEQLRYDITARYPQIVGTNDIHIRKLNQHLKQLATQPYQGMINPSKADLRLYQEQFPGFLNIFKMDYEISLVNDSILSIYLYGYSSDIGSTDSVQQSYGVNYDLVGKKELKLSDIFKRGSNYLEILSLYCKNELSEKFGPSLMSNPALAPRAENFKIWNLTQRGITLNFDACRLFKCTGGDQTIEIPFSALEDQLNLGKL